MGERIEIRRYGHLVARVEGRETLRQWIIGNVPIDNYEGVIAPTTPYKECLALAEGRHYSFNLLDKEVSTKDVGRLARVLCYAKFPEVASDIAPVYERNRYTYTTKCPCCKGENSLVLIPRNQAYKCFGCGRIGNVVNFVMDAKRLTYEEALEYLESRYVKE